MFANPIPPLSSNRPKMRFPSPFLVVLHVISCFLVSAALVSSFTQLGTWYPYFIVPSTIGFLATLPFHIHLYLVAKEHPKSPTSSNPIFITRPWLVIGFILIPLWVIIFYINILFCVGTENPTYTGVVITTVWSGLEWIVLLCISLRTMVEVWKAEKQEHLNLASSQPETTVERRELPGDEPPSKPNYIYFFSFALCTLALLFFHQPISCLPLQRYRLLPHWSTSHCSIRSLCASRRIDPIILYPFPTNQCPVCLSFGCSLVWYPSPRHPVL